MGASGIIVDGEGRWDWDWWGNVRGMGVCEVWRGGHSLRRLWVMGWGRFVEVEVGMVRADGMGVR